jgi:Zn-dependent protease with chaperone function
MTSTHEPARRPTKPNEPTQSTGSDTARRAVQAGPVIGQLLEALPWFAVSFVIVSIAGTVPGYPWGWLVVGVWLLSGAVVLLPRFESLAAKYLLRVREPGGIARERLMLTWRPVAHVAGVDASAYRTWVRKSAAPVTSALPGPALAVTDWAATTLQARQLEGVLARELARHRRGSRMVGLFAYWYSLPARLVSWAVLGLLRGIAGVHRALPILGWAIAGFLLMCWLGMVLGSLIRGDGAITLLWLATPVLAPVLLAWWSRRVEKRADRASETLGYGAALAAAFQAWLVGLGTPPRAVRAVGLLDTQPPVASRLRSLERFLARRRPH